MANANAIRTQALGSLPIAPEDPYGPMPSVTLGGTGNGTGYQPRKIYGMDYSDKVRSGPANFRPGRGIGVSQILSQREGNVGARYADGTPVPRGMPIHHAGWNTSGVGPGTRGYRGSGRIQGYSFENQGNAASKRSNYAPYFGGLNEFYQNQQQMGDWDRLQGNAAMDQNDAFGSRLAQMSRFAAGRGDMDTSAAYSQALQDRIAQQMAAQGGDVWSRTQSFPSQDGPGSYLRGSQAEVDRFSPVMQPMGEAPMAEDPQYDPSSWEIQAMLDQAALDDRSPMTSLGGGQFQTPYGTVASGVSSSPSMFTNAQGSAGPGGTQTNYGGVQSGPQFFQDAADRQREGNAFASPTDFSKPPAGMTLGDYSRRLMEAKNKLGSK